MTAIDFVAAATRIHPELIALRRELHRIPERGNDLPQTQARVLAALDGLPLEISTGRSLSSIVAVLRGTQPVPDDAEPTTVLLRGDMDALPVVEETGLEYASTNGLMHACGHDLHTAGLVGAAQLLCAERDQLPGDVVFMFQPGEELPGGAEPMITEGVLDASGRRADAAYGIHVMADLPYGEFCLKPGPLMAGCAEMVITVHGRGGHGSQPSMTLDPVPVAAEIVLGLQSYVARRINVFDPVVITVGQLQAGTALNIIPDTATLRASIRILSDNSLQQLAQDLPRLADGIAGAYGCTAETRIEIIYPTTINHPRETSVVIDQLILLYGAGRVRQMTEPLMGSEDFSFVLEKVPGAYLLLGAHPGELTGEVATNHSSRAAFDDGVLADQAAALAQLAFHRITTSVARRAPSS